MRRASLLAAFALAAAGCAPKAGGGPIAGAPPVANLMHGLWSGTASESPLGEQPYAIIFHKQGALLIAETPPTLGEEQLPPGAYQRFDFPQGPNGPTATFKTSMGSRGFLDGDLTRDADRSSPTRAIFCEAGNCGSMELRWESLGPESMSFQVRIDGKLHVDIGLRFDGEM